MESTSWRQLLGALSQVESLSDSDSGLLSFGEEPLGGIFVERGRVCWVAAQGLQRRLRDLLHSHAGVDAADFERVCERCRREGLLLGQTLVAEGLLQPQALEHALRRHSAESLLHLCDGERPTTWTVRAGRGYAPAFTFRAIDLYFDTIALRYPEKRRAAEEQLGMFIGPGWRGVAFLSGDGRHDPLPIAELGGDGLQVLRSLGRLVQNIDGAARELGEGATFSLSTTLRGDGTLTWRRDGLIFAVRCEDRTSLARATALHLARA